jgi:transposase-like protein
MDGAKEILGPWIEQSEGSKFWLRLMNELTARGIQDSLIAVVDGLKELSEAINAVFPETRSRPASSISWVTGCPSAPTKIGASWPRA